MIDQRKDTIPAILLCQTFFCSSIKTKEELTVDFSKGSAFIDLFTQDAGIFLIDREGKPLYELIWNKALKVFLHLILHIQTRLMLLMRQLLIIQ